MSFILSNGILNTEILLSEISIVFSCPLSCIVGSKIFRALAIILAVFLWFDSQFFSSHAHCEQHKCLRLCLDKYLNKAALGMSFLTRIISSVRIILLVIVNINDSFKTVNL